MNVCHGKMRMLLLDDNGIKLGVPENVLQTDKCKILCCADCEEKKYCRNVECKHKFAFNPKNCGFYPITYEQYMKIFDSIIEKNPNVSLFSFPNDGVFDQIAKNKKK